LKTAYTNKKEQIMNNDTLIVNGVGLLLVMFVFWWFFGGSLEAVWTDEPPTTIYVRDGNYQPSLVQIPAGRAKKIVFIREDPSMCASSVSFPELNVSYPLPMNQPVEISLPALQKASEITFVCQVGLFQGKIVAV
jgi:plastocyanin domain-containing protein